MNLQFEQFLLRPEQLSGARLGPLSDTSSGEMIRYFQNRRRRLSYYWNQVNSIQNHKGHDLAKKKLARVYHFQKSKKRAIKRITRTAIWLKCKCIFTLILINWAKCHIRQLRQGWPINWALFFPQSFCIVYTYPLIFDDALNFQTRFPIYKN